MGKLVTMFMGTMALGLLATAARANVIDPSIDTTHKADAKLRSDVGSQVAKYTFCLVKAKQTCEKKGVNSHIECHLQTGVVDFESPPGKVTAKFQGAISKCDSKINLTKKGTDYTGIGCPGDCNASAPGTQECADLTAFQATITSTSSSTAPKGQLPTLSLLIDNACGTATGKPGTDPIRIACVADNAKALTKYAQGLFKCEGKCENDFKNKIGNGGFDNSDVCSAASSTDANFTACVSAALAKAGTPSPNVVTGLVGALNSVIDSATAGLYDRSDPTAGPGASPCGNCGNNSREGAEECDGTDNAACPGMCQSDCTCP